MLQLWEERLPFKVLPQVTKKLVMVLVTSVPVINDSKKIVKMP